jgi:RNA polymerase sigma-70 factor (ECF subfamily)
MTGGSAEPADEMLMVRYRRGDRAAFAEIVRRYQTPLFTFSLRYLRDRDRARDVTQETFLRVVRRAEEFKHESRFSTWVFAITRNLCIDELRKGRHRSHASLEASVGEAPPLLERLSNSDVGPERRAQSGELQDGISRAIAALPDDQREVFLLRQLGGVPFADIAKITETPENTVKSRMRYALERLQKELAEFEEYARALR